MRPPRVCFPLAFLFAFHLAYLIPFIFWARRDMHIFVVGLFCLYLSFQEGMPFGKVLLSNSEGEKKRRLCVWSSSLFSLTFKRWMFTIVPLSRLRIQHISRRWMDWRGWLIHYFYFAADQPERNVMTASRLSCSCFDVHVKYPTWWTLNVSCGPSVPGGN